MIRAWDIRKMLPVGKSANSYDLGNNCYYCTAAALQNLTCGELVSKSEEMQHITGTIEDFTALFEENIVHERFITLQEVKNKLLTQLEIYNAVAFGYARKNGTGHMIVAFKVSTSVDPAGHADTPAWGFLRHIDYQSSNPQPEDGLLPAGEHETDILTYHIFYLA